MKKLLICAICLLLLSAIPIVVGNTTDSLNTNENNEIIPMDTDHYTDCVVWIFGKCNTVEGPSAWRLGFYCPINEKDFTIQAKGQENETLHVFVRATKIGTYLSYENIKIDIDFGKGIFFWAGKSILMEGNTIFVRSSAKDVWVTF